MATILNSRQRDVVAVDTRIDRLIIDRCVEAVDKLIVDDVEGYKTLMIQAYLQMGYGRPLRPEDHPTALDKILTIALRAYADREGEPVQKATARLQRRLKP